MTRPANDTAAIFALLGGCVVFGLGGIIVALLPVNSYAIAFWRLFFALLAFAAIAAVKRIPFPRHRGALGFGLLGGLFFAFDLGLWHESIHAVGPGIATLLNSLQIFFLTGIGYLFFKETPGRLRLIGLFVAIAGVTLIGSPEFQINGNAFWGFASGIISGSMLAFSMASVRQAHAHEKTHLVAMMIMFSVAGCAVLLPMALLADGAFLPPDAKSWFWAVVCGIVMQCGAWGTVVWAIPRLSLSLTGLILLSEPVAAILIDWSILHKPITPLQWLGCAVTLIAIYLGTLRRTETIS